MKDRGAPILATDRSSLERTLAELRRQKRTIGLVPTMGSLHEGHLSLVDASRATCDATVVTIFVNPTQFAPGEDLEKYPRDLDADLAMLAARGVDLAFVPTVAEMYPPGCETRIEVGSVARPLEGESRPTHFQGVATIVLKLFHLIPADAAFFGRKDYQQTLVVRRMALDLDLPIEIRVCPIVREPDGLAMSSRNAYLSREERERALALSQGLRIAEEMAARGERDSETIRSRVEDHLRTAGLEVHYVALVREGTVEPVDPHCLDGPTALLLAARAGGTRLIDNTMLLKG